MDKDMLFNTLEDELINMRSILLLIAFACESPNITVDEIYAAIHMLIESIDNTIELL